MRQVLELFGIHSVEQIVLVIAAVIVVGAAAVTAIAAVIVVVISRSFSTAIRQFVGNCIGQKFNQLFHLFLFVSHVSPVGWS